MTKKEYDQVRISPEAKEKLRQLSKDDGIPMSKYLDRLFGVEDSETPLSHLDQKPPMLGGATLGEFFQQQFNHNEQAKKEAFTNKEIHKDALDSVFDDPYYRESLDSVREKVIDIIRSEILTKPTNRYSWMAGGKEEEEEEHAR